jgi:hypothetical protein
MHIYGNAKYLGHVWSFVNFFFEFVWNVCYSSVDFGGVVFHLQLMGLVASGKVNGILITNVNQVKHFPNFEIGNIFS